MSSVVDLREDETHTVRGLINAIRRALGLMEAPFTIRSHDALVRTITFAKLQGVDCLLLEFRRPTGHNGYPAMSSWQETVFFIVKSGIDVRFVRPPQAVIPRLSIELLRRLDSSQRCLKAVRRRKAGDL